MLQRTNGEDESEIERADGDAEREPESAGSGRRTLLKGGGLALLGLPLLAGKAAAAPGSFDNYLQVYTQGFGQRRFFFDANGANLWIGGNGGEGDIIVADPNQSNGSQGRVQLDSGGGNPVSGTRIYADGSSGNMWVGGNGGEGDLIVSDQNQSTGSQGRIQLDSGGGNPVSGTRIHADGSSANLTLGGSNADGDLLLNDRFGRRIIWLDADNNRLDVYRNNGTLGVRIDGNRNGGDIFLRSIGSNGGWIGDRL